MEQPSPFALVHEFHEKFALPIAEKPRVVSAGLAARRQRLLEEEVGELGDAIASGVLEEIAHELADVVYVAYGTAISYGIDLDAVLAEVHRANLSKLGPDGRPVIRDGKVQKGDCYRSPDVARILFGESGQIPNRDGQ